MSAAELAAAQVSESRNGDSEWPARHYGGHGAPPRTFLWNQRRVCWLNLQSMYELRLAEAKTGKAIKKLPTLKGLEEAHA